MTTQPSQPIQPSQPPRRRRYLANKAFQLRYVRLLVVFTGAVIVIGAASAYLSVLYLLHRYEILAVHPSFLPVVVRALGFMVAIQLLLSLPTIVIGGIRLTHRVIGPMERIRVALERIGAGRFDTRLRLRETDELRMLADWINRAAERLEGGGRTDTTAR